MDVKKAVAKISGVGFGELSRKFTLSSKELAVDSVIAAVQDAGLDKSAIDGLIVNRSSTAEKDILSLRIQDDLGLRNLTFSDTSSSEGAAAVQMIQQASMAIHYGMAEHVVCVFADTPIMEAQSGGDAYAITMEMNNVIGWEQEYGLLGAVGAYAFAMQKYMASYGAAEEDFGAVAIANRAWAGKNPNAFLRKPMTMEDYMASKLISSPLRMFDCAFPVNGGCAVVVSAVDSSAGGDSGSAYVRGMGQGHGGYKTYGGHDNETVTAATIAADTAYSMAGITPADINHAHIYDAFSYTGIIGLEDYGFCPKGKGGAFYRDGGTAPGGKLPVNTGGGQLSGYYLQGMTQVSEAVLQATGRAEGRQLGKNDWILASNQGGRMDYHACLVLSCNKGN
ncbi:MAG: thiolase family protein [Kordiimonadaceae bacterium]|nr:thiolase family protein [Kordiimonadaceae bacterium]